MLEKAPEGHMRRLLTVMVAALVGLAGTGMAAAQGYPTHAITMIVPFPAGGATDTLARFLGERMRGILGQPVIIENVAGAAGSLGVGRTVRSAADGYTLSIGTSTTHMLIGYLKANPDKASVGIAGVGATGHLTGISFQKETGTRFQFVPYRGNAPAMQDLLAEQIDFMIEPSSNFKSLVGAGSVRPYAITGRTRLPSSPDIPTADEAGLRGFFASLWYGLWVPKDTPKDIIAKLNATMVQVLADPMVRKRFDELGIEITPLAQQSPEALRAFQKAESERWWPIIKASNIKAE